MGISAGAEVLLPFVAKQKDRLRVTGVDAACESGAIGVSPLIHEKGVFGIGYVCKFIEEHAPLDYEAFMKAVGFQTKLCKPRHPFTKGKVERLVRFVKENFLVDRTFPNISDLNWAALNWCNTQNAVFHRALGFVPQEIHFKDCAAVLRELSIDSAIRGYLCPERRLSFDGFVSYEGIRFGVPSDYLLPTVRITRDQNSIRIFSYDFSRQLVSYPVTWSRQDQIKRAVLILFSQATRTRHGGEIFLMKTMRFYVPLTASLMMLRYLKSAEKVSRVSSW